MTEPSEGTPLSRRLVADRKAIGMSQRVVASKLVTTTQNVSGWENGHYRPGPRYLQALAELYGQDAGEYLTLLNASPSSGKAGERSRRQRAKAKSPDATVDRAGADAVADGAEKINQVVPRTAKRPRRQRKPQT